MRTFAWQRESKRKDELSSSVRVEPSEIFSVILHFSTGHLFLVKALKMASIKEQCQTEEKQSRPGRKENMTGDMEGDMEKKVNEEQSQARVERFVKWRSVEDEPSGSSDQEDGEKR